MATERNPRTQTTRPRSGPAPTERQRIPLPPLPQFRGGPSAARPAVPERDRPASGGIGPDEADLHRAPSLTVLLDPDTRDGRTRRSTRPARCAPGKAGPRC